MGESKLLLALFCNKILTKSEQGVVVVVISWRSGCVTLTVTLQLYRGGECVQSTDGLLMTPVWNKIHFKGEPPFRAGLLHAQNVRMDLLRHAVYLVLVELHESLSG